jgi:hypothetical protein
MFSGCRAVASATAVKIRYSRLKYGCHPERSEGSAVAFSSFRLELRSMPDCSSGRIDEMKLRDTAGAHLVAAHDQQP